MNGMSPTSREFLALLKQNLRRTVDLAAYAAIYRHMRRDQILLACMPKSGSSYLTNVISRLDGFSRVSLSSSFGRTKREITPFNALKHARHHFIAQQHTKYSEASAAVIDQLNILPVVLVRDRAILDANPTADRKNIGKSGRGETLSEKNKAQIRAFCGLYPDIDFSLIGVSSGKNTNG